MSKLWWPGRNNPTEMSFLKTGRGVRFAAARFYLEPKYFERKTCLAMGQQTVAFQGPAHATSNPPGGTVITSIFLHDVEARCLAPQTASRISYASTSPPQLHL